MKRLPIYSTILLLLFCLSAFAQSKRPQNPEPPFNYSSQEVSFVNSKTDSIVLSGTLTLPNNIKKPPVAILISGSGPQNRDEELKGHKPFLVLADFLTKNGIAVLRYDDRGFGKSTGSFKGSTTYDFATDTESAITFLKSRTDIDTNKIGLIGHSEGGLIAPIVASTNKDVAFIVLLAGPGVDGAKVLTSQSKHMGKLMGMAEEFLNENEKLASSIYKIIQTDTDKEVIRTKITNALNGYKEKNPDSPVVNFINPIMIEQQLKILDSKWLLELIRIDPKVFLEKTTCPVLAINGSKDCQVLPALNLEGIKTALEKGKNKDITIKELEGLNHLFQTADTGNITEYETIEETFSPIALNLIKDWILERF
ncbi:alpha/beta hydrolase family protein [Seonamhaeicola marinus]|nr:alpha/beta fold hydrolase [Seonamhaeicola marinus]